MTFCLIVMICVNIYLNFQLMWTREKLVEEREINRELSIWRLQKDMEDDDQLAMDGQARAQKPE